MRLEPMKKGVVGAQVGVEESELGRDLRDGHGKGAVKERGHSRKTRGGAQAEKEAAQEHCGHVKIT